MMDSGSLVPSVVYLREASNVMEQSLPARKVYLRVEGTSSDTNSGVFDLETDERVKGISRATVVVNAAGKPIVVLEQLVFPDMAPEDLMPLEVVSIEMNGVCDTKVIHVKANDQQ